MNILKRLFCKHTYKYSRTGTITHQEADFADGCCYNTWQEDYKEYICTKCGKRKGIYITIVYGDYPSLNKVF